jgi:rod shape-determining protein MreD
MHNWFTVFITLMMALALTLLPMPEWSVWGRPAWVLMVLIYWAIILPHRIGVMTAWVMGLLMDLLTGTLLGEHALALTLVIYFVSRIHIRLRMSPMLQQGLSVLGFVGLYQFIIYCIQGFIGELPTSQLYWLSSLTSMLLWPWLFVLLRDICRWFKVA